MYLKIHNVKILDKLNLVIKNDKRFCYTNQNSKYILKN